MTHIPEVGDLLHEGPNMYRVDRVTLHGVVLSLINRPTSFSEPVTRVYAYSWTEWFAMVWDSIQRPAR